MAINTSREVLQYHVSIEPEVFGRRMRQKIFGKLSKEFGVIVFDGVMLFTPDRFEDISEEVEMPASEEGAPGTKYTVEVRYSTSLKTRDLPPQACQLFNIIFRRVMKDMNLMPVQRSHFDFSKPLMASDGLKVYPGYSLNVVRTGGTFLSIDLNHKVVRGETVKDVLMQLRRNTSSVTELKAAADRVLAGSILITPYNNRTYRYGELVVDQSPRLEFDQRGTKVSILDYFKAKHGLDIRDPDQPLIKVQVKKRREQDASAPQNITYLVPEHTAPTGLTDRQRASFQVMNSVARFTRVDPKDRMDRLLQFRQQLNSDKAGELLGKWGVDISPGLCEFEGAQISMPDIQLDSLSESPRNADWTNFVRRGALVKNMHLEDNRWLLIFPSAQAADAQALEETLRQCAAQMRINVGRAKLVELRSSRTEAYVEEIERLVTPQTRPQLVVFIEPSRIESLYDTVKTLLFVKLPVPSQCVCAKTIQNRRRLMSVCLKLILQMQAKMGGEVWKVPMHDKLKTTMICGVDVYHDKVMRGKSVLAFTATRNANFTKYFSYSAHQESGQEIAGQMQQMMEKALKDWREYNGAYPEVIIVYRDGVGEAQFDAVCRLEIDSVKAAFSEGYNPKLAFVIVQKRCNMRFFTQQGNPPPGTLVDTTVVNPDQYDFYLVSQAVTQGSASPTHYHVIYDTTEFPANIMQVITFRLCFLYYNWTGTIRVPAPCQYAHKLAYMIGQSIHRQTHVTLRDRLFYL